MSILQAIDIGLDAIIAQNTSNITQAAMLPEHVKEATWLSNGIYATIRKKSYPKRMLFNASALAVICLSIYEFNNTTVSNIQATCVWAVIITSCAWSSINVHMKKKARKIANAEAWSIVNTRKMKDETIREAMYSAAVNRLQIAK